MCPNFTTVGTQLGHCRYLKKTRLRSPTLIRLSYSRRRRRLAVWSVSVCKYERCAAVAVGARCRRRARAPGFLKGKGNARLFSSRCVIWPGLLPSVLPEIADSGHMRECLAIEIFVWPSAKIWQYSGNIRICLAIKTLSANLAIFWQYFRVEMPLHPRLGDW